MGMTVEMFMVMRFGAKTQVHSLFNYNSRYAKVIRVNSKIWL